MQKPIFLTMMIYIYRAIVFVLWPFIYFHFLVRKLQGKEDQARFNEKFGYPSRVRPEGKLVWFHAASVGESVSLFKLFNQFSQQHPDVNILITTVTVSSAKILKDNLPKNIIHQFIVIDEIKSVSRFLQYWHPDLIMWVESEFWPLILYEASKISKIILLNARISSASFKKWRLLPWLIKAILAQFTLILPQSNKDKNFLERLGACNITYLGNLKYDAAQLNVDERQYLVLNHMLKGRKIILASSTHDGEEKLIISSYIELKTKYDDIILIIAPRDGNKRTKEINALCTQYSLNITIRSKSEIITDNTDIYLADTIGELGLFFKLADIIFIGKSLDEKGGGHNPLEAARFKKPIISGNKVTNFIEIYQNLYEKNAVILIDDYKALIYNIEMLLLDEQVREKIGDNAYNIAKSKNNMVSKVIDTMLYHLTV